MRVILFTRTFSEIVTTRQVEVSIGLYAAIGFAFLCEGSLTSAWIALVFPFCALVALTSQSHAARFGAVLGMAAVMGLLVLTNYYQIANHGFMLAWVGLALAFACACEGSKSEAVLRRNAAILLAILMLVAFIQKLRSPYYLDGDLLGGLLLQGEIYANLIGLALPEWPALRQDYAQAFDAVLASAAPASVDIMVPAAIVALAWRMTIGSLIAQVVLEILILFRARAGMVLHVGILGFVALVYSTRNENEFLSVNCLLGYAMTDEKTAAVRPWYVLAVVYLLAAALIGLRPWVFS